MAVSPVAGCRALTFGDGRENYLDEHLGSLGSAGRRLALAEDSQVPSRDRLGVLADLGRFVDEFFQLTAAGGDAVRQGVTELMVRTEAALRELRARLGETGVELCHWDELGGDDRQAATEFFCDTVVPVLVPLVVERGQPLPPPANLALNVVVALGSDDGHRRLGVVELPPVTGRLLRVPSRSAGPVRVVPVEQVVAANLPLLLPGEEVRAPAVFRITRQAGVKISPGVDDMRSAVERELQFERKRRAVRLEVDAAMPVEVVEHLARDLELGPDRVYTVDGMMGLADLGQLAAEQPPAHHRRPPAYRPVPDLFRTLEARAVLAHFPYDSYAESVVALLDQAAADPALLGIKQTLYRPSPDGPTVRALVRAAERGAHVVAVVDLAARLNERASVATARALDRAGAHVVHGRVGLRTHCPLTLVVRGGGGRPVARYGVVGTGLHHPLRRREGLSLLTADPAVTADLADLFNELTGYGRPARFRTLLVGPANLRRQLLELIRRETAAGPAGRITLKVYRLVDREVVDALYQASQHGARVDVVVSGACTLRPGVAGLSEGVRVLATAGRHVETSRLFAFGSGESPSVFLSSGDLVANADRQLDVAAPVDDPAHRARLRTMLDILVGLPAWEMDADGVWHRRVSGAEDELRRLAASAPAPGAGSATLAR